MNEFKMSCCVVENFARLQGNNNKKEQSRTLFSNKIPF